MCIPLSIFQRGNKCLTVFQVKYKVTSKHDCNSSVYVHHTWLNDMLIHTNNITFAVKDVYSYNTVIIANILENKQ